MISEKSTSLDWIEEKTQEYKKDPILIEKVIRALLLLELLNGSGLEFIFKGGTALMLLIQEPRRFSIDIDIIMKKQPENLHQVFDDIVKSSSFLRWVEDERTDRGELSKQHFKFYYTPETRMKKNKESGSKEQYILLDIVYHTNPYDDQLQKTPVEHFLVLNEGAGSTSVSTPTLPAILGDKLTAFAPHTTGIPITKEMEILKQVYDINGIFDRIDSTAEVKPSFQMVGELELGFRGLKDENTEDILDDIFETSYNFCSHGHKDKGEYQKLLGGITKLNGFIYGPKFREADAQSAMAKAAYLSYLLRLESDKLEKFDRKLNMKEWMISKPAYSKLNKLKKSNPEAFFYWFKALE